MKTSKWTEQQIAFALRQAETGRILRIHLWVKIQFSANLPMVARQAQAMVRVDRSWVLFPVAVLAVQDTETSTSHSIGRFGEDCTPPKPYERLAFSPVKFRSSDQSRTVNSPLDEFLIQIL